MNIREADKADVAHITCLARLISEMHARAYPEIYQPISEKLARDLLTARLQDPQWIFRVAEQQKQISGYYLAELREISASVLLKAQRTLYLAEIMVAPELRSRGVGTALIEDLKLKANEHQILQLDVDVSGFNQPAREFFRKHDFELLRERLSLRNSTSSLK